jgi:hypothetical protein
VSAGRGEADQPWREQPDWAELFGQALRAELRLVMARYSWVDARPLPRPPCGHFQYNSATPGIRELGLGIPALDLAALGYAVFPLATGTKVPAIPRAHPPGHPCRGECGRLGHGVYDASRDRRVLTSGDFWGGCKTFGIGVPTGLVNRLAVIDLDVKNGDDGPRNFAGFLAQNGLELPAGPVTATPSGGFHLGLRWPWDAPCPGRLDILPGVDIKGCGGYVVAPADDAERALL